MFVCTYIYKQCNNKIILKKSLLDKKKKKLYEALCLQCVCTELSVTFSSKTNVPNSQPGGQWSRQNHFSGSRFFIFFFYYNENSQGYHFKTKVSLLMYELSIFYR